jgi:predicted Zn finger-like uncharacterized protein
MDKKVRADCPTCHARLVVSASKAGMTLRCPKCHTSIEVPILIPVSQPPDVAGAVLLEESDASETIQLNIAPVMTLTKKSRGVRAKGFHQATEVFGGKKTAILLVLTLIAIGAALAGEFAKQMRPTDSLRSPLAVNEQPVTQMANSIRSLEAERLDDPDFVDELTPVNHHMITQIRTLAVLADFQFVESYLGACIDDDLTTVVFTRPEATYWIDAYTHRGKDASGYLYPSSSTICLDNTDYFDRIPGRDYFEIGDVSAAKAAFRHGGLVAALAMEPDPTKQSNVRAVATALLNSVDVDRLLEAAIKGQDIDKEFECSPLRCHLWGNGKARLTFRRPH